LRSMNMFPIGGGANRVGVVVELKDPQPQQVKKFSFEVWFRPQIRKNVRPSAVVEFIDNGVTLTKVFKWNDFKHDDPRGPDREVCSYEFKGKDGSGLNLKRIAIGGHAVFNHPHTDRLNESPMDVIISNVKVETTKNGTLPVSYAVNTSMVEKGKEPDGLMKKLEPEKN
jgi:hypothetical protein